MSLLIISLLFCLNTADFQENFTDFYDENITFTTISTDITEITDSYNSTTEFPLIFNKNTTKLPTEYNKNKIDNNEFCSCDLTVNYCDLNCCCDETCTYNQKLLFLECKPTPIHHDPIYCYPTDIKYVNYTKIYWQYPENRLFCIVKSNLPPYNIIQLSESISMEKSDKIISKSFKWTQQIKKDDTDKILKYGSEIWFQTEEKQTFLFSLPDKFSTNVCVQQKQIRFLKDFKSECSQTILNENNTFLNPNTYFQKLYFVLSSNLNSTNEDNNQTNCLQTNIFLCDESLNNCNDHQIDSNFKLSCQKTEIHNEYSCTMAVQRIRYDFYHNTTHGLTKINLYMFLKNFTYHINDQFEFKQQFEVNFYWDGYQTNYTSILSGNPGYLFGKYILAGDLISNSTLKYIDHDYEDPTKNFLVFPKNFEGFCVLNKDKYFAVEFGFNSKSICAFKFISKKYENVTDICINLQKQILALWQINTSKFVGTFGNSNRLKTSEWIEITYKFSNTMIFDKIRGEIKDKTLICKNIVTELTVNVIYVYFNFKQKKDQPKILNVLFDVLETNEIILHFSDYDVYSVTVNLIVDIMFFDITKPDLKELVKPPSIQITLPTDFFYPFALGGQKVFVFNVWLLLFVCISFLI